MIEGGCFCGKVRFAVDDGEYPVANCHCTMCRRTSAAPFVTWIVVPATAFRFTRGEPALLKSSPRGTRTFCGDCGTPMTCVVADRADKVDITTGSLDHPEDFVPVHVVHADTKLPWLGQTEFPSGA